jgi:peptidoglycan/xylan/chitin deacetylase (PgdA/CDA1 family)
MHHACAEFDAESMNACDWMNIEEFKTKVQAMQHDGVEFISLTEASKHVSKDWIRCKKYAVLTFDDGYASLKEILPWLEEQKIPVTLFINGKYLDGKSYRKNPKESYLTKDEIWGLISPLIEIGNHGWEHTDAVDMTKNQFGVYMGMNVELLYTHPRYIPFHAYTYGHHTEEEDIYLQQMGLTPVLVDGQYNYNCKMYIHRELLDK